MSDVLRTIYDDDVETLFVKQSEILITKNINHYRYNALLDGSYISEIISYMKILHADIRLMVNNTTQFHKNNKDYYVDFKDQYYKLNHDFELDEGVTNTTFGEYITDTILNSDYHYRYLEWLYLNQPNIGYQDSIIGKTNAIIVPDNNDENKLKLGIGNNIKIVAYGNTILDSLLLKIVLVLYSKRNPSISYMNYNQTYEKLPIANRVALGFSYGIILNYWHKEPGVGFNLKKAIAAFEHGSQILLFDGDYLGVIIELISVSGKSTIGVIGFRLSSENLNLYFKIYTFSQLANVIMFQIKPSIIDTYSLNNLIYLG